MSRTFTCNGSIGETTSSYTLKVVKELATASGKCEFDESSVYRFRKNSIEVGVTDTALPVSMPFGQVVTPKFIFLRAVNPVTLTLTTASGVATLTLGETAHPEGILVLLGGGVTAITVTAVQLDDTQLECWVAG